MSDITTTSESTQAGGGTGHPGSGGAGPAKAYLELIELKTSSGPGGGSGTKISFQFNPEEFTVTKSAKWSDPIPSKVTAIAQYLGPQQASMTLKMFLDGSADGTDVSKKVRQLIEACVPTSDSTSKNHPLPPGVRFGWDQVYFEGYLENVEATYQLFRPNGTPVRAMCKLTLKELETELPRQNPTSGSISTIGSHQVVDGDSLPSIAYAEYGDATRWRRIAQLNGIDDPMALTPGTRLLIPPGPTDGVHR